MKYLAALLVVVACWTAVMTWIGPPHHLRPWVHSFGSVYAVWEQTTNAAQVIT